MSNKPNPQPTPAVYDASALLDEIQADSKPFMLRGETFDLPAPTAWPDAVMDAVGRNDAVAAGRLILGDDNYDRFVAVGGNASFLQQVVVHVHGASAGESPGSSSS